MLRSGAGLSTLATAVGFGCGSILTGLSIGMVRTGGSAVRSIDPQRNDCLSFIS
jgi:hypothetical protein